MGRRWSYIPQTVDIRNGKRRCTTRGFANHDEKSDFQFPFLHVLIQHGRAIWFDRIYLSYPWCNVQFKSKIPTTITHTTNLCLENDHLKKFPLLTRSFPQSILVDLCFWNLKTFDCVLLTTKHEVKYICVHPLTSARSSLETVYSRIRHYKHPHPTHCVRLFLAVQDSSISWSLRAK